MLIDPKTMENTNDAGASDRSIAENDYNPNLERIMPDGGHEDDITAEDEIAAANIAAGGGPKKKKKSKSKSQRATVKPITYHSCFTPCVLMLIVGVESRYWI